MRLEGIATGSRLRLPFGSRSRCYARPPRRHLSRFFRDSSVLRFSRGCWAALAEAASSRHTCTARKFRCRLLQRHESLMRISTSACSPSIPLRPCLRLRVLRPQAAIRHTADMSQRCFFCSPAGFTGFASASASAAKNAKR